MTDCVIAHTELARDCLHQTGKFVVEKGILSCVHDAYNKKVGAKIGS